MRGRRTPARGALAVSLLLLPGARTVATNPRVVAPPAIAPPAATGITPSAWHRQRRAAILAEHPEVRGLIGQDARTLPALALANVAQLGAAFGAGHAHLPPTVLLPLGLLVGGTLSLWQFACLHDIKHGTATMHRGTKINDVLFYGSMPSLFGYYLYLRYGHLSHHREFGTAPIAQLFDSSQAEFEDGDVMFVAHRQRLKGDPAEKRVEAVGEAVGGLGVSISRSFYAFAWTDAAGWAGAAWNAAVYSSAMTMERAALCVNEKVVAACGRNFFFPSKPDAFHQTCAKYARANTAVHVALLLAAGPGALLWLFLAEVGWQLPIHPASAMFVSNHPSLESPDGTGCQPTSSVYWGGAMYDWLCCFSNYHVEHHDFPDVPAFRLRELRDLAAPFYADDAISGARDGWVQTMRRTFEAREGFYACSGVAPRDEDLDATL